MSARTTKHHKIPWVADGILYLIEANSDTIKVGSPTWFTWIEEANSFSYSDSNGSFTARLEKTRGGNRYWKAFRRQGGKLRSQYLGRTKDLDLIRLHTAAKRLSLEISPITSVSPSNPPAADQINLQKDLYPLTKFYIPPLPPRILHRDHLFEPFRNPTRSVILVTAPPDYGKTTLAADWILTDKPSVAWVSLDEKDDDPIRFWSAIASCLNTIQSGLAARSLSLMQSATNPLDHDFVPSLINDLVEGLSILPTSQPAVLVLDDFQKIENPKVHGALSAFITRLPSQIRLVILSQTDSPLQLGHLRLHGGLVEIGMSDLAFQRSEVDTYIQENLDLEMPAKVVEDLTQQTEGWIGAIQFAMTYVQAGHSFQDMLATLAGSGSTLYNPLFEEEFSHLPEPVTQFLLVTSILDRFCVGLCDRLIGEGQRRKEDVLSTREQRQPSSSQNILDYLMNHNFFIVPLDLEGVWFRYHRLFAQYIVRRLQAKSRKLTIKLHGTAARWLVEQGLYQEAISHSLSSEDNKFAAELIAKGGSIALLDGKYSTLKTWLQALPRDVVRTNPYLCLFATFVDIIFSELNQAQADLNDLDQCLQTSKKEAPPGQDLYMMRDILKAYLQATLYQEVSSGLKLLRKIYRNIPENDYQLRSIAKAALMDIHNRVDCPTNAELDAQELAALSKKAGNFRSYFRGMGEVANAYFKMGKLHAAQQTLEKAFRQAYSISAEELVDDVASTIACHLAYERNDLDKAWKENSRRLALVRDLGPSVQAGQVFFMQCKLHLTRNDFNQAHQALDQVDDLFGSPFHPLSAPLAAWHAHVWLKQYMLDDNPDYALEAAINWAEVVSEQVQPGETYVLHETIWPTHITLARVRLAEGKISEALSLIGKIRTQLEYKHAQGVLIQVLAVQALIQEASGDHNGSLDTLLQALTWGESEGFVRSITDAGPPINALLADVRDELKPPMQMNRYIYKLLEAVPITGLPESNYPENDPSIHLTHAEMKILRKLSEGYSTAEIARELIVSDNTVKTHISHILNKFHVTRRAQAVHRARELTMLG